MYMMPEKHQQVFNHMDLTAAFATYNKQQLLYTFIQHETIVRMPLVPNQANLTAETKKLTMVAESHSVQHSLSPCSGQ